MAIPGIVLGVGVFLTYSHPQLMLYGTLWILLIAFLDHRNAGRLPADVGGLPRHPSGARGSQPHPRRQPAEDVAADHRALLRTSVIATWCFVFIGTIRELSATILLTTANTKLVSVIIYDLNESGDLGAISVLGLMLLAVSFAIVFLANRFPLLGGPGLQRAG